MTGVMPREIMTQEEISIYVAWFAQEFGAISRQEFLEEVYSVVRNWQVPSSWVLEYLSSDEWAHLYEKDEFESNHQLILEILKLAFLRFSLQPVQLKNALERFFLCEEHGGFECPDEKLNQIYESYQAPKLELEESKLQQELSRYFESA